MVIIIDERGQLANRLIQFAHFTANSLEHGHELVNFNFVRHARSFEGTDGKGHRSTRVFLSGSTSGHRLRVRCLKVMYRAARHGATWAGRVCDIRATHDAIGRQLNLNDPEFLCVAQAHRLFVEGWLFRDYTNLQKHADQVRSLFMPVKRHRDRVSRLLDTARKGPGCLLVGVHVRRKDYREFEGGRLFYTDAQYSTLMDSVRGAYSGTRVAFLVCSDEDTEPLRRATSSVAGTGDPVEDLLALSGCDLIVGPRSTYSLWASFFGKVPLHHVEDPTAVVKPSDFRVSDL